MFLFVVSVDECLSSPCQNGGTCVDGVGGYTCNCTLDYRETNCEVLGKTVGVFMMAILQKL